MKAQTRLDLALLRRSLAPLQGRWQRQAKRIDALSLRERAILFLSVVVVLAALFDAFVLTPLSTRARQRTEAQAVQATELRQLREQFVAASQTASSDPAVALQQRLLGASVERQRLDAELREASPQTDAAALSTVLQRLLTQQPGLLLERLTLLDETPVVASKAGSSLLQGMSWQGVELQVQGRFHDLQRQLHTLEEALPGLRWGEVRLTAGAPGEPSRMVAQLFLLKVQP